MLGDFHVPIIDRGSNPVSVIFVDDLVSSYGPWNEDIDDDALKARHKWKRKPLEVVFEINPGGPQIRTILVHMNSEAIHSLFDLDNFQKISYSNRKPLLRQALKLSDRSDQLMETANPLLVVVMGDMNDGPGLDPFEEIVGKSFVETVMGSVYEPSKIFHNAPLVDVCGLPIEEKLMDCRFSRSRQPFVRFAFHATPKDH